MTGPLSIARRLMLFFAAYAAAVLAMRVVFPWGMTLDEAEQLVLSQRLAWGYHGQPPLYAWLQFLCCGLFGANAFALGFLKNGLLFAVYAVHFLLARRLLRDDGWARAATVALFLFTDMAWGILAGMTQTMLLHLACALTWIGELRLSERRDARGYVALGACIALGFLAKYNYAFFLLAMLGAMLVVPAHRRVLLDRRILLSLLAAVALLVPHLAWAWEHAGQLAEHLDRRIQLAGAGAGAGSRLGALWTVVAKTLEILGIPMLVFLAAFRGQNFARLPARGAHQQAWARLFRVYLAVLFCLLGLAALLTAPGAARARWIQPFYQLVPFAFVLRLMPVEGAARRRVWLVRAAFALGVAAAVAFWARPFLAASTGRVNRYNVPIHAMAEPIRALGFESGVILADDVFLAGLLKLTFPKAAAHAPGMGYDDLPDLDGRPLLVAWFTADGPDAPAPLVALLRDAGRSWPSAPALRIQRNYLYSDQTLEIAVLLLPATRRE
ncbi:MAG: glycosyltransferase family 39 protein [Planctomycetaceae bacterium]